MLIGKPPDIPSSEITSREAYLHYLSRRRFLKGAAAASVAAIAADRLNQLVSPRTAVRAGTKLQTVPSPLTTTGEQLTPYDDITHYNNFYEFGVGKGDPSKNAGGLPTRPWTVKVDGKVAKPLTFDIDMLLKLHPLEDRVYRHRCVEAWSMVIPWVGYSLSEFIKQCNPLPSAKYVQFISYYSSRVEQWAGQDPGIYWPYSEGLRMDEAMHPLTLLTFDIDDLLKLRPLEDRVYRHRCVEAWSMVIPWVGYSLSEFIKQCNPLPSAKYVQFLSYYDRHVEKWAEEDATIYWPYSEGLRMDEAMNPLTLLTFGLYGETLPNQDGAPVRVVLPWKYGFKSAKSIVTVRFVDKQPPTTWNDQAPNEYGFYSNVNPDVDHPRWSQKTERRIGLPFYGQRRTTLMFNGYTDQVASMYAGMNLRKNY